MEDGEAAHRWYHKSAPVENVYRASGLIEAHEAAGVLLERDGGALDLAWAGLTPELGHQLVDHRQTGGR